uniref:Secreted protein n=1 Tax=Pipistrellus kuhlii TaxID=59472 RepID=A0A7J7W3N3_PIPKU|nr:hypothetical protein mPipKuh1_008194 [Pipistrellus kuhlii]
MRGLRLIFALGQHLGMLSVCLAPISPHKLICTLPTHSTPTSPTFQTFGLCLLGIQVIRPSTFNISTMLNYAVENFELPVYSVLLRGWRLSCYTHQPQFPRPPGGHTHFRPALALGDVAHRPLTAGHGARVFLHQLLLLLDLG